MTLEILVFVGAALIGILFYWRESKNNRLYRILNKIAYSKKLQMKPDDPKGFVYKQIFILRLVYIMAVYLLVYGIVALLTPFQIFSFELYVASVVGTLLGTYVASFLVKAGTTIEENQDLLDDTVDKGKELLEDITNIKIGKDEDEEAETSEDKTEEKKEEPPKKSARERLKEDGLL